MEKGPRQGTNEDFLFEIEERSSQVYSQVKERFSEWKSMSGKEKTALANRLRKVGWMYVPNRGWERKHNSAA